MAANTDIKERRITNIASENGVAIKTLHKLLRNNGYFDSHNMPKERFINDGCFAITSTEFLSSYGGRQATKPCVEIKDAGMVIVDGLIMEYKKRRNVKHVIRTSKSKQESLWAQLNALWVKANPA